MSGKSKQPAWDIAVSVVAWAGALVLFWKSLLWLAGTALAREQIVHAAIVLLLGLIFLLRERPEATPVVLRFGRRATGFFVGACFGAALAGILHQPLLMLCALGFVILGFVRKIRLLRVVALVFFLFSVLKIVLYDASALSPAAKSFCMLVLGACILAVTYLYPKIRAALVRSKR